MTRTIGMIRVMVFVMVNGHIGDGKENLKSPFKGSADSLDKEVP